MTTIWLGSEQSLIEAEASMEKLNKFRADNPDLFSARVAVNAAESAELAPLLTVREGVGVVTVQGNLVPGSYGRYGNLFGVTGYSDVQAALIQAAKLPDVHQILLAIDSPGGNALGSEDTRAMVETVNKLKPVTAINTGMMTSAAYWIASSAKQIFSAATALTGSIGAVTQRISRVKQLEKDGIDVEVYRSGELKALGSAAEPITKAVATEAQDMVNYLGGVFQDSVFKARNITSSATRAEIAKGGILTPVKAAEYGLIDGVSTFNKVFSDLQRKAKAKAEVTTANRQTVFGSSAENTASGVDNPSQVKGTPMFNAETTLTDDQLQQLAAVAAAATADAAATPAPATAPAADASPAAPDAAAAALATAQAEVASMKAKVDELTAKVGTLETSLSSATANFDAVAPIVRGLTKSMFVALNKSADVDAIAASDLATQYAAVSKEFAEKFKVGRVSAPAVNAAASAQPATNNPAPSPAFLATAKSLPGAF